MKGKDDDGKKKTAVEINIGDDQPLYDGAFDSLFSKTTRNLRHNFNQVET